MEWIIFFAIGGLVYFVSKNNFNSQSRVNRTNNINVTISTVASDESVYDEMEIRKKYYSLLKPTKWSDYQRLNKYEKITAFALEGYEDLEIIKHILKQYFLHDDVPNDKKLDNEIKSKIKSLGFKLGDIKQLVMPYIFMASRVSDYNTEINLTTMVYWRYSTILDSNSKDLDKKLNKYTTHRDSEFWDKFYPPNYRDDRCYVSAYSQQKINRARSNFNMELPNEVIEPDPDYNFNIPKYIIENLF